MRVTNKARVEGSIVQATLISEVSTYCSAYFAEDFASKLFCTDRHEAPEDNSPNRRLSIFDTFGHAIGRGTKRVLDDDDYAAAHNYVLLNCPEIQPLLTEFDDCMMNTGRISTAQSLDKLRREEFANWLHKRVLVDRDLDSNIRKVGLKPLKQSTFYNAYDVNGFRFQTETYGQHKSTVNSGVCVKGECTDDTQHDYYGVLQEIVELEYQGFGNKLVLFKCHWFDITNGVRIDREHGIVEVKHTSTLRGSDNFILGCQAIQVYYLPYASEKREKT